MNKTTAIFLALDGVRCVSVAYDTGGTDHKGKMIPKDIKSFKTMDRSIEKDQLVVIPTDNRWGFTIGKVVDVDLHVDFDSNEQMRWIVSVLDTAAYDRMLKSEGEMMNVVADADRNARQQKLKEQIFANVDPAKLAAIGFQGAGKSPIPASGFEPDHRGGAQPPSAPPFASPPNDLGPF